MKLLIRFCYLTVMIFSLSLIASCGDDDEVVVVPTTPVVEEDPNLVEFAAANADFSSLVAAVTKADLATVLSGDGPFTVFAPTNAAFQSLLDSNADWSSLDDIPTALLTTVLTNHVVSGDVRSTDLSTGYVETLSATPHGANASLFVNTDGGVTLNGAAAVTTADNVVSNGVIHVIDQVILPPTIVTFATSNPSFSTLVAALTQTGLMTDFVAALNGAGPFTVFAPTNDAFQALLDSNADWNGLADIPVDLLENVLKYHVTAAGNVRAGELTDGQVVPTLLENETFSIDLTGSPKINAGANTANIIITDVQGQNGVVHAIDAVLLPSSLATPNAVEFAAANENFSILVEAVTKAGLGGVLSGEGPFTIFAPTNDAFVALLGSNADWNSLDDIPTDLLATVLTNHVVSGDVRSTDLATGYVETLSATPHGANASLFVNTDGGVTLNGTASVTAADNAVSNGVIHVIDQVILPPTIVTFATSNPSFSTLVAALTQTGLMTDFVAALSGAGPFTVFAPTNDAFQALLDSNADWNGLADIPVDLLENVLKYHVTAAGNIRAGDLADGQVVPTLLDGSTFSIDLSGSPKINAGSSTANIIITDVQGQNGVVHAIDAVLLP